jgi:hypothetical protein
MGRFPDRGEMRGPEESEKSAFWTIYRGEADSAAACPER